MTATLAEIAGAPPVVTSTRTVGLVSMRGLDCVPFATGRKFKLDRFVETLNELQGSFEFICEDDHWEFGTYDATHLYRNERYFERLVQTRQRRDWDAAIAITAEELQNGVFNTHRESASVGVITANRFKEYLPPGGTLYRYLAYLVMCETLCLLARRQFEHREYKLCLFDMCEKKSDLKDCLAAPTIHADCLTRLRSAGITEQQIDDVYKILGYVGTSSLGKLVTRGVSEPGSGFLLGGVVALAASVVVALSISAALIVASGVMLLFLFVMWHKAVRGRPRRPKRAGKVKRWRLLLSGE
jgi:hypothetical protein